jgi:hypothetical protein
MAVSKCYRPNVDYTAADQVEVTSSPTNSKNAFVPATKLVDATNVAIGTSGNPLVMSAAGLPASLGQKTPAASLPVVQAGLEYETVAAGVTDQVLGGSGAAGDYLSHIVIQPVTTGAGAVTVKDGASTIYLFTSGTLADLSPKTVAFGIFSAGALSVTTGANVTVLAVGNFT